MDILANGNHGCLGEWDRVEERGFVEGKEAFLENFIWKYGIHSSASVHANPTQTARRILWVLKGHPEVKTEPVSLDDVQYSAYSLETLEKYSVQLEKQRFGDSKQLASIIRQCEVQVNMTKWSPNYNLWCK